MKKIKICGIPECGYPETECLNLCWHPDEQRMDVIGQNGNDGLAYGYVHIQTQAEPPRPTFTPPQHDATRRPQSRFAAGSIQRTISISAVDEPNCPSAADMVNHPPHYTAHPSGVECIAITEHMGFCLGNAVKYIWRADLKSDALEDLRKARWYIDREIKRRENKETL